MESDTSGQVKQADTNPNNSQIVVLEQGAIVTQPSQATLLKRIGHLSWPHVGLGLLATCAIATPISLINRWLYTHSYEETSKAYVASDTDAVNTRITGQVTTVIAAENQLVKKGTVLVKIDPKDYQAKLQTAMTTLAVATEQVKAGAIKLRYSKAKLTTSKQSPIPGASDGAVLAAVREVKATQVKLFEQSSKFAQTQSDYERLVKLNQRGVISWQTLNQPKANYDKQLLERNIRLGKFIGAQTKLTQATLNFLDAQTKLAQEKINQAQKNFVSQVELIRNIKEPQITPPTTSKQLNLTPQQIEQQKLAEQKKQLAAQAEEKKITAQKQAAEKKLTAQLNQQKKIITNLTEQKKLVLQQAETTFNQQEYEISKASYKAAKKAEAQAQAQLKTAQYHLYYTKITAPNNGKINIKRVQLGQQIQPGQTLMALVQQKPWIAADFPEEQLKKIKPGQSVQIKINAITNKTFNGKVQSILPPSKTQYYHLRPPVKISFDPTTLGKYKSRITPGTPVSVKINLE